MLISAVDTGVDGFAETNRLRVPEVESAALAIPRRLETRKGRPPLISHAEKFNGTSNPWCASKQGLAMIRGRLLTKLCRSRARQSGLTGFACAADE